MSALVDTVNSNIPLKPPERSGFAERLLAIPLVSFLISLYGFSKRKSRYLETVFTRGERVFLNAKQRATSLTSDLKTQIDVHKADLVSVTITTARKRVSRVVMSSKKLVKRGKRGVIGFVEQKVRFVLQSLPGRVVMWSVDRTCGVTEAALLLVRPDLRKTKKVEMRNGQNGTRAAISREHASDTLNHEKVSSGGPLFGILAILTKPLELLVYVMRGVQAYLHTVTEDRDHSKKNGCLSPEKQTEIQSRRKVSPRKKIKTGLVNQLQRTVNYFGLSNLVPGLRRKFHIDISGHSKGQLMTSPNKNEDDDKKRKYEDILSESESDSDEDLQTLDLDQYVSDEDPDFKPGGAESTDSEEYREGDTESDIEFETTIGGTTQVKVSNKSSSKETTPTARPELKQDKGKPDATKVVDSSRTKEQTKTSPLKATQPTVLTPTKSIPKSTVLKSSTPKPSSGKENTANQDSKSIAGSKKTPESKHGSFENTDKKSDPKNPPLAHGDNKKAESKPANNGSKKNSHIATLNTLNYTWCYGCVMRYSTSDLSDAEVKKVRAEMHRFLVIYFLSRFLKYPGIVTFSFCRAPTGIRNKRRKILTLLTKPHVDLNCNVATEVDRNCGPRSQFADIREKYDCACTCCPVS